MVDLNAQSIIMAIQTPKTPMPKNFPRRYPNPILNTHMENMDTDMVNLASLADLKPFGRVKEGIQIIIAPMPWQIRRFIAISVTSGDKLYKPIKGFANVKIAMFKKNMIM